MTPLMLLCVALLAALLLGLPIFMSLGIATCIALFVSDVPLNMIPAGLIPRGRSISSFGHPLFHPGGIAHGVGRRHPADHRRGGQTRRTNLWRSGRHDDFGLHVLFRHQRVRARNHGGGRGPHDPGHDPGGVWARLCRGRGLLRRNPGNSHSSFEPDDHLRRYRQRVHHRDVPGGNPAGIDYRLGALFRGLVRGEAVRFQGVGRRVHLGGVL